MTDAQTLAHQAAALTVLARLAVQFPTLPSAYLVSSDVTPLRVGVQLNHVEALESWREALHIAADKVAIRSHSTDGRMSLGFPGDVEGIAFDVYVVFELAAPQKQEATA
ncbi:hypothetical protein [Streptomyces sp. NPDC052225]|uniref:hypothetical protein n=1 Tax=Streptomyces sp. NPDC052225 TaxID=3154949 RepID=UPI00343012B0